MKVSADQQSIKTKRENDDITSEVLTYRRITKTCNRSISSFLQKTVLEEESEETVAKDYLMMAMMKVKKILLKDETYETAEIDLAELETKQSHLR